MTSWRKTIEGFIHCTKKDKVSSTKEYMQTACGQRFFGEAMSKKDEKKEDIVSPHWEGEKKQSKTRGNK